jgi:aspartyl-tRNA(Asn)/glutamyl-tRNA(Gln) amidotransferase subunit A
LTDLARLGVVEASALLARRSVSATELTSGLLARIRDVDGTHSHEGDPGSINAWVRVYEEDALAAAARADERLGEAAVRRDGPAPPLTGVPIGLKDLYGVAGKPITASSTLLRDVAVEDCDAWKRLSAAGMVLLGHLHTHEFAAGGTTDQVGSPWALERSAGGSSGGSAAALAAHMIPAATGTDTAGSLRIPSACSGTSAIKPTRGLVSLAGVVPLAWSLDHAGPMARSLADCVMLFDAMAGPDRRRAESSLHAAPRRSGRPLAGARLAVSPRLGSVELDADVAAGFDAALDASRRLGAELVAPPAPGLPDAVGDDFVDVLTTEMLVYHRRFDDQREAYRPSLREWLETGERRAMSAEDYVAAQGRRLETTGAWADWLAERRIDALLEPTIPIVAPLRGDGYDHAGTDYALISLTHLWDWTGFPVAALPAGVGAESGLPVGVSLIGPAGDDWDILALGQSLQAELGVPEPPPLAVPDV